MSVVTPPEEEAVVDTEEPQTSLIKRITSLQSVWILGVLLVIVVVFHYHGWRQVLFRQQLLTHLAEHCRLGRSRGGDDLRHHYVGHRLVGRLGARLLLSLSQRK